jgi:hypothetical protein
MCCFGVSRYVAGLAEPIYINEDISKKKKKTSRKKKLTCGLRDG